MEKDLIRFAKKGDHKAFATLFHENYSFLVKYLIKITMNPDTAEELAQETMVKCMEKIHQYNGKAKFSTWLISIATNLYIDLQRKQKRHRSWELGEQIDRKLKWQIESKNEEWNDTLKALGTVKEAFRIPIILRHYYGYSYEEIASIVGVSTGTVKSRIHNGILAVREELKLDEDS